MREQKQENKEKRDVAILNIISHTRPWETRDEGTHANENKISTLTGKNRTKKELTTGS